MASEAGAELYILVVPSLTILLGVCIVYHRSCKASAGVNMQEVERSHLVEKHILPVTTFSRKVFEIAILTNSMLQT